MPRGDLGSLHNRAQEGMSDLQAKGLILHDRAQEGMSDLRLRCEKIKV